MAYQDPRVHGRGSGWVRNDHVLDQDSSHPILYFRDKHSTNDASAANDSTGSSDRNGAAEDHLQNYHFDGYASNSGADQIIHSHYHARQNDRQELSRHQDFHRPWQSANPGIDRVINDVAVREAILRLEGRTHHNSRDSARQLQPISSQSRRHQTRSSEWYERNSRPLGQSNLRDLDMARGATDATRRWSDEDPRSGPYNNIGQTGRISDYERGASQQHEQDGEDYEYDDRSDTLY